MREGVEGLTIARSLFRQHLMFSHESEVGHILGQQQSLLHRIGHIAYFAPLEILY